MRAALLLFGYAAALSVAGARWLPGASWPRRAPRAGIAVWQALTVTVVASVVLAGLALAVPSARVGAHSEGLLQACLMVLHARYATPQGAAAGATGAVLVLAVGGRVVWCATRAVAAAARRRARHGEALTLVARPGPAPGVLLLDDDRPAVYCLPGPRRIVLTTGALRRLDDRQLGAVLAHERAHLTGRHHLALAFAAALASAFPLRVFTAAADQVGRLVEMAADDSATRRSHRLDLAGALLALAAARVPAGSLGAAGTAAAQRVRRLIDMPHRPGRARRAVTAAAVALAAALLALPAATVAAAAIAGCSAHGAAVPPRAAVTHAGHCGGTCRAG